MLEAIQFLTSVNGGATAIPVEGGWRDDQGRLILEEPVIVYSYLSDPERFMTFLPEIRRFCTGWAARPIRAKSCANSMGSSIAYVNSIRLRKERDL